MAICRLRLGYFRESSALPPSGNAGNHEQVFKLAKNMGLQNKALLLICLLKVFSESPTTPLTV